MRTTAAVHPAPQWGEVPSTQAVKAVAVGYLRGERRLALAGGNVSELDKYLSRQERLIGKLGDMVKYLGDPDRSEAMSLLRRFQTPYGLRGADWSRVKVLAGRGKALKAAGKRAREQRQHYVYALDDGYAVKIGFSSCPEARLAALQTGHPNKLRLVWKRAYPSRRKAANAERKLHTIHKAIRLRGEWYSHEILKSL